MELIVSSHKIRGELRLHGSYDFFAGKLCASLTVYLLTHALPHTEFGRHLEQRQLQVKHRR